MKTTLIISSVLFGIICGILLFKYSKTAMDAEHTLNQERYNRMLAEENLEKASSTINNLQSQLSATQKKIKTIETLVEQTKGMNADLKDRLDKTSKVNEQLDERVKELQQSPPETAASPTQAEPTTDPKPAGNPS